MKVCNPTMNASKIMGSRRARQSGFSLLEVLVAVLIMSIGLAGLAGMQALGVKNNHSAYHRSQATVLAYDMADRMRANTSTVGNYLTSHMTLTSANIQADCQSTSGCTAVNLAKNDLYEWRTALNAALPFPTGEITLAGTIYTINVSWDDDRTGAVDVDDPTFQVSFQP